MQRRPYFVCLFRAGRGRDRGYPDSVHAQVSPESHVTVGVAHHDGPAKVYLWKVSFGSKGHAWVRLAAGALVVQVRAIVNRIQPPSGCDDGSVHLLVYRFKCRRGEEAFADAPLVSDHNEAAEDSA